MTEPRKTPAYAALIGRLRNLGPDDSGFREIGNEAADEITKLTERCSAYKGQVEAGAAEIARLRSDLATARKALENARAALADGAFTGPFVDVALEQINAALAQFAHFREGSDA